MVVFVLKNVSVKQNKSHSRSLDVHLVFITSCMPIVHMAKVMFSEFPSFCPQGGGSGKVHYEHILATKVLMPVGGLGVQENALRACSCYKSAHARVCVGGGGRGCLGKCTIQVMSQGMSTLLAYQHEVCNQYSNCLLVHYANEGLPE